MLHTAELLRRFLVPFLVGGGSLLGILLLGLVIQRGLRELAWRRRQTLVARYRRLVDPIVQSGPTPFEIARLRRVPRPHRPILAELLLAPLRATRGDVVVHVRDAARGMGLVHEWRAAAANRRWWVRAAAIRALGAIEEEAAFPAVIAALEDGSQEVRAAAVEAAGRLGDPRAIAPLLQDLANASRYQRARVVDALRSLGPEVTPGLAELGRAHPQHARLAADVLGLIGTAAAIDPLLQWCGDERAEVRAAALGALGSLGLDDRSHYFALRALGDADPDTRAMAARALGRGGRQDAVHYLAERLDDEWLPAAQAAGALRQLGGGGFAALQARAGDEGQAGDLARQMLWSRAAIDVPA